MGYNRRITCLMRQLDGFQSFREGADLVQLDEDAVAGKLGEGYTDEQAEALIESEVDRINEKSPRFKKIAHIIIRKREFDKTTGLKIRRFVEDNKRA